MWWADLGAPRASEPGFRRPVLVVQDDSFNRSDLGTVVVVGVTSNLRLAQVPGNVGLSASASGLDRDSVVNVSQLATVDKGWLEERIAHLPSDVMAEVDYGLALVLGFGTG